MEDERSQESLDEENLSTTSSNQKEEQEEDDDERENERNLNMNDILSVKKCKSWNRNWLYELITTTRTLHSSSKTPLDLRDKALVVAPMVEQSDLAFRLQCRRYGANLCFTPMIHSKLFCTNLSYKAKFFPHIGACSSGMDRPLVAQLCGSEINYMIQTALQIQPHVDAIDINCGCPQGIAKKGKYGAFLLEDEHLLLDIVKALHAVLDIPLCVKVRLLPSGLEDSLKLYRRLVFEGGAALLTIHGRTRFEKGAMTGPANWSAIQAVVKELGTHIPILANGSISSLHDVRACLKLTGADGVMSSEAILEYPSLFCDEVLASGGMGRIYNDNDDDEHDLIEEDDPQQQQQQQQQNDDDETKNITKSGPGRLQLAQEYMLLAQQYPPQCNGQASGIKCLRMHVHRMLHHDLQVHHSLRTRICMAASWNDMWDCLVELKRYHAQTKHDPSRETLGWYYRHRIPGQTWTEQKARDAFVPRHELSDDAGSCMDALFGEE